MQDETKNFELDYRDEEGWHIMAACGHRVSGSVQQGDKILMCPNCQFLVRFQNISIVYEERMPDEKEVKP